MSERIATVPTMAALMRSSSSSKYAKYFLQFPRKFRAARKSRSNTRVPTPATRPISKTRAGNATAWCSPRCISTAQQQSAVRSNRGQRIHRGQCRQPGVAAGRVRRRQSTSGESASVGVSGRAGLGSGWFRKLPSRLQRHHRGAEAPCAGLRQAGAGDPQRPTLFCRGQAAVPKSPTGLQRHGANGVQRCAGARRRHQCQHRRPRCV